MIRNNYHINISSIFMNFLNLEILDISFNNIKENSFKSLCDALCLLNNLKEFYCNCNMIKNEGI